MQQWLAVLRNPQRLDLIGCRITNAGMQSLSVLTNLQMLNLIRMTDTGVQLLAVLCNLQQLHLNFCSHQRSLSALGTRPNVVTSM